MLNAVIPNFKAELWKKTILFQNDILVVQTYTQIEEDKQEIINLFNVFDCRKPVTRSESRIAPPQDDKKRYQKIATITVSVEIARHAKEYQKVNFKIYLYIL